MDYNYGLNRPVCKKCTPRFCILYGPTYCFHVDVLFIMLLWDFGFFFMTRSKYVIEKEDVQRQARGIMIVHCTLDELFLFLCHFKLCSFSYWLFFVLNSLEQECFDCTPRSCMSKMAEIVTFQEGPSFAPKYDGWRL